jgi:hypothetical protein
MPEEFVPLVVVELWSEGVVELLPVASVALAGF